MKKFLAVIAIVAFLGGMSAPALANSNAAMNNIELADKDPKKAKKAKKAEKAEKSTEAKSDCSKPCEKTCGDKK